MTKSIVVINQSRLLPLMWAYAAQHISDLKKTEGGRCIGMAVTLAESIGKNELGSKRTTVDKLLALENDLLAGKPVSKDPELDSFISAVMKNHGNKSAGPVIVAGEFDDDAFIEVCTWLKNPGETIIFGSNYEDSKRETHAIAVSLMDDNPRTYCLIDANGVASITLGGSIPYSLVEITCDIKIVPLFVKKALGLQKGMVTSIHFRSFDSVPRVPDIDRNEFYQKYLSVSDEKIEQIALKVLEKLEAKEEEKSYYNLVETQLTQYIKAQDFTQYEQLLETEKRRLSQPDFMAFLEQKNSRGETALEIAIRHDNYGCVNYLCSLGADIEIKKGIKFSSEYTVFFKQLHNQKRYVREFDLFARFLNTRFEEAKSPPQAIAKKCRIYLLEFALRLLRAVEQLPLEIERIRQIVVECKFMHYSPKKSFKSFSFKTRPKYPTDPEEGALISTSIFKEYGTHHSTHLFYKICDPSVIHSENQATFQKLSRQISKLYPQLRTESYHMKMIKGMENELNFYSSIPELKKFGDKLFWIDCLSQKVSLAEQENIIKEVLFLINVIYRKENSLQFRLEELIRLKVMFDAFPVFFKKNKNATVLSGKKQLTTLFASVSGKLLHKMPKEEQGKLPPILFKQTKWGLCHSMLNYSIKDDQIGKMRASTLNSYS